MLRGHVMADFDLHWAYHQSDRAAYTGNPENTSEQWYGMASEVGSWPLRGMGGWAIEAGGKTAGQICIMQPPHYPEVEIGWILLDGFEGRGIAHRAALLALDWAWTQAELTTLVSYIVPGNARSIALAQRLGAVHDPSAALPLGDDPEHTVVYRHSPDSDGAPEAYA